jgi:hypothetical protein
MIINVVKDGNLIVTISPTAFAVGILSRISRI